MAPSTKRDTPLTSEMSCTAAHPPQAEQCLERAGRWRRHVLHVLRVLVASSYGVAAQCAATLAAVTKPGSENEAARKAAMHSSSAPVPVYLPH